MPGVEAAFLLLTPPSPRAPTGSSCFLWQSYGDAVDHVVVMFSKLMTKMERQADDALDEQLGQHKNTIYSALGALARLGPLILDETQVDETRLVGRAWGKLLLYYTLGSDPALWPAWERREGEFIMHDKGYYHS